MKNRLLTCVLTAIVTGAMAVVAHPAVAATPVPDAWSSGSAGPGSTYANVGEKTITATNAARLKTAWQTAYGANGPAPAVVAGVVYYVLNPDTVTDHSVLVARSARSGARLWSVQLPEGQYIRGEAVADGIVVVPFEGWHKLAGLTAVSVATHKVIWSRSRPAGHPSTDDGSSGPIAIDSGRVYYLAGDYNLSAYKVKTGAVIWHQTPPLDVEAIAAGGGRLYLGGYLGARQSGLRVLEGATGRQGWMVPNLYGQPVVDGSMLVAPTAGGAGAVPAAGCGHSVCRTRWAESFGASAYTNFIGGATASSFFVVYEPVNPYATGVLKRVDTATGKVEWTYKDAQPIGQFPVRVNNTVWALTDVNHVAGWSVSATSSTPLKTIDLPAADNGVEGGIAGADGSLLVGIWIGDLTAYRVPGA